MIVTISTREEEISHAKPAKNVFLKNHLIISITQITVQTSSLGRGELPEAAVELTDAVVGEAALAVLLLADVLQAGVGGVSP